MDIQIKTLPEMTGITGTSRAAIEKSIGKAVDARVRFNGLLRNASERTISPWIAVLDAYCQL
jgi:hypothetical protein